MFFTIYGKMYNGFIETKDKTKYKFEHETYPWGMCYATLKEIQPERYVIVRLFPIEFYEQFKK